MFTGIIASVGTVTNKQSLPTGLELTIDAPAICKQLIIGDSVAINGVCSTVTKLTQQKLFTVQYSPETLAKTNLTEIKLNQPVNLELCLTPNSRLGGHFVQGHIDEVGKLNKATLSNDFGLLEVTFSPEFAPLLVEKGAITIDGISLTIASLGPTSFTCQIIPHTWQNTTLKTKKANDTVNLEYDILGKYLHRFHTLKSTTSDQSLMQTLQNSGFL